MKFCKVYAGQEAGKLTVSDANAQQTTKKKSKGMSPCSVTVCHVGFGPVLLWSASDVEMYQVVRAGSVVPDSVVVAALQHIGAISA
jgi:hypothetical protein